MNIKNLEKNAKTASSAPKTAIKYLLNCLFVYQKGEKKEAEQALGYIGFVLSKDGLKEDKTAPSGYKPFASTLNLIKGLKEPQRANSILSSMGGTWQNNYKDVDPDNYELPIIKEEDYGEDQIRIFLKAGGRDNPFPIVVAKNNKGQWKITEGFSTMCLDVRPPETETKDF